VEDSGHYECLAHATDGSNDWRRVLVGEARLRVVTEGAVVATKWNGAERALDGADAGMDGVGTLGVDVVGSRSKVMMTVRSSCARPWKRWLRRHGPRGSAGDGERRTSRGPAEHAAAEGPVEEFVREAEEDELLEDSGIGRAARLVSGRMGVAAGGGGRGRRGHDRGVREWDGQHPACPL
jgi:hypothetical protein